MARHLANKKHNAVRSRENLQMIAELVTIASVRAATQL